MGFGARVQQYVVEVNSPEALNVSIITLKNMILTFVIDQTWFLLNHVKQPNVQNQVKQLTLSSS